MIMFPQNLTISFPVDMEKLNDYSRFYTSKNDLDVQPACVFFRDLTLTTHVPSGTVAWSNRAAVAILDAARSTFTRRNCESGGSLWADTYK